MKREEALLAMAYQRGDYEGGLAVIEEIYNNFESRACRNCAWCKEDSNDTGVWVECRNKDSMMYSNSLLTERGYPYIVKDSCSKWEEKDEK